MSTGGALVLDAQPVVALMRDEPSAEAVQLRIEAAAASGEVLICAVNWSEVLAFGMRSLGAEETARFVGQLDLVPVRVVEAGAVLAGRAAAIRVAHRLSLGDSFAAALALATGLPLLTADADFGKLTADGLEVDMIG